MPIDPSTGMPLDPATLQQLQEQQMFQQLGGGRGGAGPTQDQAAMAQAVSSLFPSQQVQQARAVQTALQQATAATPQNDGENDLDFSIRQLRAQRDAVARFDPQTAASMNTQLLKLGQMKFEQARLTAQDQRAGESESDLHAERSAQLPVRQLQGDEAQAQRATGILAYVGTGLTGSNPTFHPFDISDPDQRDAYMHARTQPGAVPLSQDTVEKIVASRQETLARANAQLTAGNLPTDTKELLYQRYLTSGKLDTSGMTRQPGMVASLWTYISQRSAAEGNTAAAVYANGQATQAAGAVLKSYESGNDHKSLLAINTAVNHLSGLDPLINALGTGDLKAFNAARIVFAQQTGSPAPGNFEMLRNMVVGEVAKATYNLGGTEAERAELTKPLATANSPEQLRGAAQTAARILAGKTDALKLAYETATGGRYGDFDAKFLTPATRKMLGRDVVMPSAAAGQTPPAGPGLSAPGPAGQQVTTPGASPLRVSSPDDYARVPAGAQYVAPDGSMRVKGQ